MDVLSCKHTSQDPTKKRIPAGMYLKCPFGPFPQFTCSATQEVMATSNVDLLAVISWAGLHIIRVHLVTLADSGRLLLTTTKTSDL